jgi:hypothetical protein
LRFKNEEVDEFMKQHKGGERFIRNYLEDPSSKPGSPRIEVNSLKYPYKEFAWLFTDIIGLQSTTFLPNYFIYALHYALHESAIID